MIIVIMIISSHASEYNHDDENDDDNDGESRNGTRSRTLLIHDLPSLEQCSMQRCRVDVVNRGSTSDALERHGRNHSRTLPHDHELWLHSQSTS